MDLQRAASAADANLAATAPRALALRTTGITYPGNSRYVSAVRADLRALLGGCPMVDDVLVCVSELATNAVLHSHSRLAEGTFTVRGKISPAVPQHRSSAWRKRRNSTTAQCSAFQYAMGTDI